MEIFYHTKHAKIVRILYTDGLCCDLSSTVVPRANLQSSLGQDWIILFRLLAPAFRSPTTLDSLGLRLVDVVRRDPAFIIRFRARGNRRPIGSHNRNLVRGVNFLRLTR